MYAQWSSWRNQASHRSTEKDLVINEIYRFEYVIRAGIGEFHTNAGFGADLAPRDKSVCEAGGKSGFLTPPVPRNPLG